MLLNHTDHFYHTYIIVGNRRSATNGVVYGIKFNATPQSAPSFFSGYAPVVGIFSLFHYTWSWGPTSLHRKIPRIASSV